MTDYDSPWKEALALFFREFLVFYFPEAHAAIDWTRGYEALDKEFQRIARRAKVGKRRADKLFKVWLRDGSERWLLIHVEVQADYDKGFSERMFDYTAAMRQLYNRTVVSLAVLCDDRPDGGRRPSPMANGAAAWN